MLDLKSLLGTMLQSGMSPSSSRRIEHAVQDPRVAGSGSMLQDILARAQQAMSDTSQEVKAGNPVAVGGLGALAGALLGGARGGAARGAVGGAAMAVLGQVAFTALQKHLAKQAETSGRVVTEEDIPLGMREPQTAGEEAVLRSRAQIILQAMINAAKADGQIDGAEMNRILGKLDEAGADQDTKDLVLNEMRAPLDLEGLVAQVEAPDLAVEVYAASLLAIEVDTPAERSYLQRLAHALRLQPAVVADLHEAMGVSAA